MTYLELPIEQPTSFELVINKRTAEDIGLSVPESMLIRTDEVIKWFAFFAASAYSRWSALGWSAYRGAADYNGRALGQPLNRSF